MFVLVTQSPTLSPKGAIPSFGSQIHPARQDGIDIWVHVDQICIFRVLGGFCLQYFQNKFLKNIQLFKIKFLRNRGAASVGEYNR